MDWRQPTGGARRFRTVPEVLAQPRPPKALTGPTVDTAPLSAGKQGRRPGSVSSEADQNRVFAVSPPLACNSYQRSFCFRGPKTRSLAGAKRETACTDLLYLSKGGGAWFRGRGIGVFGRGGEARGDEFFPARWHLPGSGRRCVSSLVGTGPDRSGCREARGR